MTRSDPWEGVGVLLVDGNNLLHALEGHAGPVAVRGFLARLTDRVPPGVEATVVLDGSPDPGTPMSTRLRRGLAIRHSGRSSADSLIVQLVEGHPYLLRAEIVVVTNDAELSDRVRRAGARPRPVAWLALRLTESRRPPAAPGTTIGGPRPGIDRRPGGPAPGQDHRGHGKRAGGSPRDSGPGRGAERDAGGDEEHPREPWRPGRGATRKRGNPRRGH